MEHSGVQMCLFAFHTLIHILYGWCLNLLIWYLSFNVSFLVCPIVCLLRKMLHITLYFWLLISYIFHKPFNINLVVEYVYLAKNIYSLLVRHLCVCLIIDLSGLPMCLFVFHTTSYGWYLCLMIWYFSFWAGVPFGVLTWKYDTNKHILLIV